MKTSENLNKWVEDSKKNDSYWIEAAKLDFAMSLENQRKLAAMSYSDLAKNIATSPAYISKVFRGDSNLTIESMVKLARATGGELKIGISNKEESISTAAPEVCQDISPQIANWANVIHFHKTDLQRIIRSKGSFTKNASSYIFDDREAGNGDSHSQAAA